MRFFLTLAALCLFFSTQPAQAGADSYIFLLKAKGNPYWMAMADGIRDAADTRSIEVIIYFSNSDPASQEEVNLCQTLVRTKPKFLVLAATTPNIAVQCFKQANKAGVRVGTIDAKISVAEAEKAGAKMVFSVGSDNFPTASVAQLPYLIGKRAVELAVDTPATEESGTTEITATPVQTEDMIDAK